MTHRAGKFAFLLHADVAGSTSLVQSDEHLAHERIHATFKRFGVTIARYHGRVRELRGDALLAEFERASDAVTAALAFQADQAMHNAQIEDDIRPTVRVGIAMGEVVIADRTVTGAGVVLAQRMEQLAEPGGVCVTAAIRESLPQRMPFEQQSLGEREIKGFDEPVRAYAVRLREGVSPPRPADLSRGRRSPAARWAMAAVIIVLIFGSGLMAWYQFSAPEFEPASPEDMALPLPDKPSIAVLPFANLSGDPGNEYLSDGLSENIITELSRFSQLFVIARQSSFSYKGKLVTVQQVSEELGVRYVLEGSVQVSDDRLRVTAQLVNAVEGNHVWAERFDRPVDDFFMVQDEITRTIVATLRSNIDLSEFERVKTKPPKSLSAYERWTLGGTHWFKYTEQDNERARELFEQALALDPEYASAYRGLVWVYINGYRWGWSESLSRERCLELALEMAEKGLELAPFNHRLHQAQAAALLQAGRLEEALAAFDRAVSLNPNDASVLASTSEPLIYSGQPEEAIRLVKHAIRLNPYHPVWYLWNLGFAQYFAGDYESAVQSFLQMKTMPNLARRQLAAAYVGLGEIDKAKSVMAEFLKNAPDYTIEKLRLNFEGKFTNPEDLNRFIVDVRTAGLPEK